jgi:hypothetical protein
VVKAPKLPLDGLYLCFGIACNPFALGQGGLVVLARDEQAEVSEAYQLE